MKGLDDRETLEAMGSSNPGKVILDGGTSRLPTERSVKRAAKRLQALVVF